jgi:hypothetical protein
VKKIVYITLTSFILALLWSYTVLAETQDDLYAIIKSKYPGDIQTMNLYGASEENIKQFIKDFAARMEQKDPLTKENFDKEAIYTFLFLYLSGDHINVFDAVFNGWNLSTSKLLDTLNKSGSSAVLDLLPDGFKEIGKIVKERLLTTEPTQETAVVEGYVSIYLGEAGTGLNEIIFTKIKQEEIEATFRELRITLKNSIDNTEITFMGSEAFIPDHNGLLATNNGEQKIAGKFSLPQISVNYDHLEISGSGYLTQNITLTLGVKEINTINTLTNPLEVYPGDIGQLVSNQGLVFMPDGKISNVDFTAWLMIFKNALIGSIPYEDTRKADLTKDGTVNNVDFTLWLASYKKWTERNVFHD